VVLASRPVTSEGWRLSSAARRRCRPNPHTPTHTRGPYLHTRLEPEDGRAYVTPHWATSALRVPFRHVHLFQPRIAARPATYPSPPIPPCTVY
jgi:hypothetical protein